MGIYDVPAGMLIEEAAKDFKSRVKKPAFADWAKTGPHRERAPNNLEWFFTRMASVLYRTYKEGNLGTGRLRVYYGGRKNRGVRPEKKVKASGKILRVCLQMLEKEGLVKKEKKGRVITGKGEKFLSDKAKVAKVVFDDILKRRQERSEEGTQKRAANRAKAEQAGQAQQAAAQQKPKPIQGGQNAGVQGTKPPLAPKPAPQQGEAKKAAEGPQHEFKLVPNPKRGQDDDGRGRAEAKKA